MSASAETLLKRIRWLIVLFMIGLVLSGITAFPLAHELDLLGRIVSSSAVPVPDGLRWWIFHVRDGLASTWRDYPFLGYGTDWLAFGHLVIALFFLGPLRDPVRNIWVLHAGLISCAGVIPLALICGEIRGIPFYWRLIDCSFGVLGAFPLWLAVRMARLLERSLSRA